MRHSLSSGWRHAIKPLLALLALCVCVCVCVWGGGGGGGGISFCGLVARQSTGHFSHKGLIMRSFFVASLNKLLSKSTAGWFHSCRDLQYVFQKWCTWCALCFGIVKFFSYPSGPRLTVKYTDGLVVHCFIRTTVQNIQAVWLYFVPFDCAIYSDGLIVFCFIWTLVQNMQTVWLGFILLDHSAKYTDSLAVLCFIGLLCKIYKRFGWALFYWTTVQNVQTVWLYTDDKIYGRFGWVLF